MSAEPKECLKDIAMAQWEEASVITVRGTVKSSGSTACHSLHSSFLSAAWRAMLNLAVMSCQ